MGRLDDSLELVTFELRLLTQAPFLLRLLLQASLAMRSLHGGWEVDVLKLLVQVEKFEVLRTL